MAQIVALDTSAVVFLLSNEPESEPTLRRWTNVNENFRRLHDAGASFFLPAPILAELRAGGHGGIEIAKALEARGSKLHIEALDDRAAQIAGQMIEKTLPIRGASDNRNAMKFDALIAAVAIAAGADALLTTDSKDYAKYLSAVSSTLTIIDGDTLSGQQVVTIGR